MLTHGNMLSNASCSRTTGAGATGGPGDVLIHALPIFHVHGLFVAIHGALHQRQQDDLDGQVRPQGRHRRHARAPPCSWACPRCTCACWPSGFEQAMRCEHAPVHRRLGTAAHRNLQGMAAAHRPHHSGALRHERNHHAHQQPLRADKRYKGQDERRGGTVGFPCRASACACRATTAKTCPWARSAASRSRAPTCSRATGACPRRRRKSSPKDGYFKTGDVGKVDERGYVHIVGRSKDLIISGGYNVYPAEIEGYINDMPGVAESALVGVPHPDFGEVGVAVVIAKPGANWMPTPSWPSSSRKLANFKIPKRCFLWWRSCRAIPWARCRRTCCGQSEDRFYRAWCPRSGPMQQLGQGRLFHHSD
jgi:malonyl-CoA/methylmalonyl-CoA synthetase